MCNFYFDYNNNEPFYFCDVNGCNYRTRTEKDFITISIARDNGNHLLEYVVVKMDPRVSIKLLLWHWFSYSGDIFAYTFYHNGKKLNSDASFLSQGVHNFDWITIKTVWPHALDIKLSPTITDYAFPSNWPDFLADCVDDYLEDWRLQASVSFDYSELLSRLKTISSTTFMSKDDKWLFTLIENLFQTLYWTTKCSSANDYLAVIHLSYKLFTGNTLTSQLHTFLTGSDSILQADFESSVRELRNLFNVTTLAMTSPLVKKLHALYTFMLAQGFLSKFGVELTEEESSTLLKSSKIDYSDPTSFVVCVVDSTLFVCEKIIDFKKSKDPTTFIHNESSYATWCAEADRLLQLAPFTGNLAPHGTTYFSFISDLNAALEAGEAIRRYSKNSLGVESVYFSKKLMTLHLLKNTEVTRRSSQKERKAPFGVLVHGGSSVAKSTFTKMLYYYYGSLHGLAKDDHFRYVRNPAEEFWNNFDSSKWCIQLDDVAFLKPQKASETDPTLLELLNVVNNVPYSPPQASLEDKGKTPVLAEFVVATSNAKDLNAHEYFYCPLAVRRRLPYVVNIQPKAEYLHENGKFIDAQQLPVFDGKFPDFWTITVQKLIPITVGSTDRARLETVEVFTNVHDFLKHFGTATLEHLGVQDKSLVCDTGMRDIVVCPLCFTPSYECKCLQALDMRSRIIDSFLGYYSQLVLYWFSFSWAWSFLHYTIKITIFKTMLCKFINTLSSKVQIKFYGMINSAPVPQGFRGAILGLSAMGVAIYMFMKLSNSKRNSTTKSGDSESKPVETQLSEVVTQVDEDSNPWYAETLEHVLIKIKSKSRESMVYTETDSVPTYVPQGNVFGTTEKDLSKSDTSNVWYKDSIELNLFDVPRASLSSVYKTSSQIRELFCQNCVRLTIEDVSEGLKIRTGGVFVRGQMLVMNSHVFRGGKEFTITIQNMGESEFSSNHTLRLKRRDLGFDLTKDLACVQVLSMPPHKDITKFWNEVQIPVTRIVSLKRVQSGGVDFQDIFNVEYTPNFPIEALKIQLPMYLGVGQRESQFGDCGSLGVALTPRGPVIMGIHTVGYKSTYGFPHVTKTELFALLKSTPGLEHVDGGTTPMFSLNGNVKLQEPHSKSLFRFLESGTARFYGTLPGFRPSPKSKVSATPLAVECTEFFGITAKFGKPMMNGWLPWRKNVVEMVKPTVNYDRRTLNLAKLDYLEDILQGLPQGWEKELVLLSREATVNGLPGVKFIDKINTNSSMGHPWNTTKKKFLHASVSEDYPHGVDFGEDIWKMVDDMEALYKTGVRAMPVSTACLKDEATPILKCESGKTRLFVVSNVIHSLLTRKYLLSFVRLVQSNQILFEAAPGLTVQSTEWGKLYTELTKFGTHKLIAGDYGYYDKHMIADFILTAYDIISIIFEKAGFCEEEIVVIRGIAMDIAFSLVNVNGDVVELYGTNPSGHPLTVIINSIVNSLYQRYVFYTLRPTSSVVKFKAAVALVTYGDDNIMGVSDVTPWFNHTTIQVCLADIGVTYTMADKEAASVPYIHINDCSFLKRKWVFDNDVGAWLAPLEMNSIHKMLTKWIPSTTIDEYAQMLAVIESANMEFFFYGKSKFNNARAFFVTLLMREPYCHYVRETTLPDWDTLYLRFWQASGINKEPILDSGLGGSLFSIIQSQKNNNVAQNVHEQGSPSLTQECEDNALAGSGALINPEHYNLQMEAESTTPLPNGESSHVESIQTVTFTDNSLGNLEMLPSSGNAVAKVDNTEDIGLGTFLARPTDIGSFTWTTSDVGPGLASIQPWHMFLSDTAIVNKIQNYAFLRGNLHIKVIINATPFQYGALRVCYSPLLGFVGDKIRSSADPFGSLVPLSQQPGFYVYPQANAGGEMVLRFFLHKNWLDITNESEVMNMGTLTYKIFAPLQVASTGGSTSVTVRTYAWMTDVELMGSTSKLVLQGDEYGNGPISAPASALANIAARLSTIPVIGRFARATEIGASAVSSIATLFGYTNVPVIDNVHAYHPMNAPMLASAHIGVPIQKLTLDPKQELSIDPSPHGIGSQDELSLSYLKSKESYFTQIDWDTGMTVAYPLFTMRVTPSIHQFANILDTVPTLVGYRVNHTPLSYVGQMFKHWRGDIILRIKIVCTKFHKGRLKVCYDPRGDISSTDPAVNTVYSQIIDIGETDDVEIRIPYHQDLGWLKNENAVGRINYGNAVSIPPLVGSDNGTLSIHVLTELTAPVSSAVQLMFYIRGADNFEYANPTTKIGGFVPSFFALQSEDITSQSVTHLVMGSPTLEQPDRYALNFGECVGSLRNILHRAMVFDTVPMYTGISGTFATLRKAYKRMPYTPGFDPNFSGTNAHKVTVPSGNAPFAFTTMPHIAYISGMYLGYRGGVNYIVTPSTELSGYVDDIRVVRTTDSSSAVSRFLATAATTGYSASVSAKAYFLNRQWNIRDGLGGMAITTTRTNGSVMFNMPDYNNYNFSLVDPSTYVLGSATDGTDIQTVNMQILLKKVSTSDADVLSTMAIQTEISAGVDFTCLHFLCCPTLDYMSATPVPIA